MREFACLDNFTTTFNVQKFEGEGEERKKVPGDVAKVALQKILDFYLDRDMSKKRECVAYVAPKG